MTDRRDATENILAQADALMRRPRTFVAQQRDQALPLDAGTNPDTDADLPVLTDVVVDRPGLLPVAAQDSGPLSAEFHQAIEEELVAWIDTELPKAVVRITDGLADRLIEELVANARAHLLVSVRKRLGDPES